MAKNKVYSSFAEAVADSLRQRIAELGFEVQDTRQGPRWRYVGTRREK